MTQSPDPETQLRELWTRTGVSKERQDAILGDISAKAQPGERVGPFLIQHPLDQESAAIS